MPNMLTRNFILVGATVLGVKVQSGVSHCREKRQLWYSSQTVKGGRTRALHRCGQLILRENYQQRNGTGELEAQLKKGIGEEGISSGRGEQG